MPSAQETENQNAASGRRDHFSYSSITRSNASASKSDMPMIASRALRTTPAMFAVSTSKMSMPAQPPKKIHVLRFGIVPALRPQAQHIVIVVGEHDAPALLHRADHRFHDAKRIGNMLEDEARVRNVE